MDRPAPARIQAVAALRALCRRCAAFPAAAASATRGLVVAVAGRVGRWAAHCAPKRARRVPIVEHSGDTSATPKDGTVGAPLAARFPSAGADARTRPGLVAREPSEPSEPSRIPDVIVVDDDPVMFGMLRYALRAGGFSFQHYSSGPEALEALLSLDTAGHRPVVLLDADLPGLDGFSLHERLRVERPGAYTTVFLSARTAEAEQLRAYRAGALDYLAKPVNMRILMAKVPVWVARSARQP